MNPNPFINDDFSGLPSGRSRPRPPATNGRLPLTHGSGPGGSNSFGIEMTTFNTAANRNPYQPTVTALSPPRRTAWNDSRARPVPGTNRSGSNDFRDEWSFCEAQFRGVAGFTIKYTDGWPYSPCFKIRPQGRRNALPVPLGCALMGDSTKNTRHFFCDVSGTKWQTIKFHRSGNELLHFSYKPSFFGGRYSPLMSVYFPEYPDRVGYFKVHEKFTKNAEIVDCINNVRFTTRPHFNELCTRIEIVDETGNVAAIMTGAWSKFSGQEKCYFVNFSDDIMQKSGVTKAIFLAALTVLAIDNREQVIIDNVFVFGLGIAFLILLVAFIIQAA